MQVDKATVERYEKHAPELLEFVTSGEAEHIMKRDGETDYCVKYDKGWCGIHASKGTEYLGDACHFFPRITRQLGSQTTMQTASLSCPEVARQALLGAAPQLWHKTEDGRLPFSLRNYLPDELPEEEKALAVHEAFLVAATDDETGLGHLIAKLHTVAQAMEKIDKATWPMAVGFYLNSADSRLKEPISEPNDRIHLYHSLAGLVGASKKTNRPRLQAVLDTLQQALDVTVQDGTGNIEIGSKYLDNQQAMDEAWQFIEAQWEPYLKRVLRTELEMALFPFSGFGETLSDRIAIIGVRIATLKLALKSHLLIHQTLTEAEAITITQSLARFLDHLADPTLSMQIYTETGWVKTERLWGLFA